MSIEETPSPFDKLRQAESRLISRKVHRAGIEPATQ
jgi:hypothetical protein